MFVILIVSLIILNGANVKAENDFSLLNYFSGDYTVYTSGDNGENSVDLGFCYMNSQKVSGHIIGESMVIERLEVGSALTTLKAKVIKTEYLEDGTVVIYAYTTLINDKVDVSGNRVNLQIATRDNRTVIGWPLILGSY